MLNGRHNILFFIIAFIALIVPCTVSAQDGGFRDVDFQVMMKNKSTGKTEYEPVQYCIVKSVKKAHDVRIALEKAVSEQEEDLAAEPSVYINKALKKQEIVLQISANNGTVKAQFED